MRGTKRLAAVMLATLFVLGIVVAVSSGVIQATATLTPTVTAVPTATATAVPTATATTLPTPTATVIPAEIWVVPDSLTFVATEGATNLSYKILSIGNAGGGTMRWTATSPMGWLSLIPPLGTLASPSLIASVQVHVDITGMTPGVYEGAIYVNSPDAQDQWQIIQVILTVKSKSGAVAPSVTATATAAPPTPTPTSTPTPTPPASGGGGAPPWVWPVVGVLIAVCAALAGFALITTGVLGKMFKGKPKGDVGEDIYEGGADDSGGGGGGDYGDEV